jgi:hypothetical protein
MSPPITGLRGGASGQSYSMIRSTNARAAAASRELAEETGCDAIALPGRDSPVTRLIVHESLALPAA